MKLHCKTTGSSGFEVEAEPSDSISKLKEEIYKKLPKPPAAAVELILVRVSDGKNNGVRNSAKTRELLKSLVTEVRKVEFPEETEDEDEIPGFKWMNGDVSAKVMNLSYKLTRYLLSKDTDEGCVDILVILPEETEKKTVGCIFFFAKSKIFVDV